MRDHMSTESFTDAVNKIPHMGYTTRIDLALKLAKAELFERANGGRDDVPKVLIVITDGSQVLHRLLKVGLEKSDQTVGQSLSQN